MPERATPPTTRRTAAPDLLLPSQHFDHIRPRLDLDGPRRLMLAVLEDAVHLFVTCAGARDRLTRALFSETEAWFEDRRSRRLYSFERICVVLDLDPDYLRRGLRACKSGAASVHGTDSGQPKPTARQGPARRWPQHRGPPRSPGQAVG